MAAAVRLIEREGVVCIEASRPALHAARTLEANWRDPFLPAWQDGHDLQVGPLVVPGRGPCFSCYQARERQHAVALGVHDAMVAHFTAVLPPAPRPDVRDGEADGDSEEDGGGGTDAAVMHVLDEGVPGRVVRGEIRGRVIARHACPCRRGQRPREADEALDEPALAPSVRGIEWFPVDDALVLVNGRRPVVLHGRAALGLMPRLLPLLGSGRSDADLAWELDVPESAVGGALSALSARGLDLR